MASQIQQSLMNPGWWDLDLTNLPDVIYQALDYWGEIYVLPVEVDPALETKASLKALSTYTGVLWKKGRDQTTRQVLISGPGNDIWLGKDGRGDLFEVALNYDDETFANVVTALIPDALTAGTISTPGGAGTFNGRAAFMDDPRAGLARLMDIYGAEWRVNPDNTFDVGTPTQLGYSITPTAVAFPLSNEAVRMMDPDYRAIEATSLNLTSDVLDYATKILLAGQGAGQTIILGTGTAATTYKDPNGNELVWKQVANEPILSIDNADSLAQAIADEFGVIKQVATIGLDRYVIGGDYTLGDYIYVYAPPDLTDTDNTLDAFGTMIHPKVIRLVGVAFPITGAVYFRAHDDTIHNLTPYLITSKMAPSLKVGDLAKAAIDVKLGNQSVLGRISDDGGVPEEVSTVGHVVTQGVYLDIEGSSRVWINIAFPRQNLNTDGSTIADGMLYQIRYGEKAAVDGGSGYERRAIDYDPAVATPEFDLYDLPPGADYYYSIRVKDYYDNRGAWHASETVTLTADIIAPSTPAVASVAGNPGSILVKHTLAKDGEATYTLERDIAKLRIYVSKSAIDFTPDPDPASGTFNLVGEIPVSAANLELEIAAVQSFPVPNDASSPDTERWVKVTAVDWSGNESGATTNGVTVTAELISALWVGSLSASDITTGTLDASLITVANLSASVIVTGTLDASVVTVSNLSASVIVTGTLDASVVTVSNIDADNINTGALNADLITTGTLDASGITVSNLSASSINTGTLDASVVTVSNLSASVITTGTLDAARISAGSLSVDLLILGSFDNLVSDPGFELAEADSPHDMTDDSGGSWSTGSSYGRSGNQVNFNATGMANDASLYLNGSRTDLYAHPVVREGDDVHFEVYTRVRNAAGATLQVRARLNWREADGTWISHTSGDWDTAANDYTTLISVDGTAPADVGYVVFEIQVDYNAAVTAGYYYFDDAYARRMVDNNIIASGISADKITAGTLNASVVTVSNLTATNITAGTLNNLRLPTTISRSILTGSSYVSAGSSYGFRFTGSATTGLTYSAGLTVSSAGSVLANFTTTYLTMYRDTIPNSGGGPDLGTALKWWGTIYYATLSAHSDRGSKEDIIGLSDSMSLIRAVRPVKFKWKETADTVEKDRLLKEARGLEENLDKLRSTLPNEFETLETAAIETQIKDVTDRAYAAVRSGGRYHPGLIAQELKQALDDVGLDDALVLDPQHNDPSAEPGAMSIDYMGLVPHLIQALKEMDDRVGRLEQST